MNRNIVAALLALAVLPPIGAQHAPPPASGPAPLLHVRFSGPPGMRVALYQGQAPARDLGAPVAVGLRPGYVYRFQIQGMTDYPNVALYPSLEVRGSLELPPNLSAANYPAPVTFTDNDIRRALSGALVTKVIYLEHPERAIPTATSPGEALEADVPNYRDLLDEARRRGRLVAVLRLGERAFEPSELASLSTPGTILLPGERALGAAARPPCLPWAGVCLYDPILGRRPPEEECLHDGGDIGLPAGIGPDGRLGGLDPTDSVAEYTDNTGRRRVAKSNRVCICVPRFAALRHETPVAAYETAMRLVSTAGVQPRGQLQTRLPSREKEQVEYLARFIGRERPSGTQNTVSLVELANATHTALIGRIEGLHVVGAVLEKPIVQHPPKPLVLCKWASAQAAQVGDVITFYLKYSNYGGQPISDVVVSDSLSGRLEYVPGTAKMDREAVFTTQQNEAGSLILRWEVGGRLMPGESGTVSFQARVR
jgi:uncharacterized repeat protein (TIGR01451 family)